MVWDFELFPREHTEDDEQSLRSLTDRRRSGNFDEDDVLSEAFQHTLFLLRSPKLGPTRAYIDISEPHFILIMRHDAQPKGEELLRGEALSIAATMITGLDRLGSDGFLYIPVLLVSFMGTLQGRILQAYFDGENLAIWKTKIYSFVSADDAKRSIDVFLQQMVCDPMFDTKCVVWDDPWSPDSTQVESDVRW